MQLAICHGGLETPEATADKLLENGAYIIETGPSFFLDNDDGKIANAAEILRGKGINIRSIPMPKANPE